MDIDIVIDADLLTQSIRSRIRAPEIVGTFGLGGPGTLVFDHLHVASVKLRRVAHPVDIRVADGTRRTIDTAHRLRVDVDLRIHLADRSAVIAGGVEGATDTIPLTLGVTYEISARLIDDGSGDREARLRAELVSKSATLPDDGLDAAFDEALRDAEIDVPIEIGAFTGALGGDAEIRNFGIATDAQHERVAMRFEIQNVAASPVQTWRDFYSSPPSFLGGKQMAVRIDERALRQVAEDTMDEAVAGANQLESLERASALWLASQPGIHVGCYVDVEDACPNLDEISVDLYTMVTFSLRKIDDVRNLRIDSRITWDINDADVAACALALVGPFMGLAVGPILDRIAAIIGAAIFADDFALDPNLLPAEEGCEVVSHDDDHVLQRCHRPVEVENALLGRFVPTEVSGDARGLVLRGGPPPPSDGPFLPPPPFISITPLGWATRLNCNTHRVDVDSLGGVKVQGTVYRIEVLTSDPNTGAPGARPQPIPFFEVWWDAPERTISVTPSTNAAVVAQYLAAPYPCQLFVYTSAGPRFIDLGPMPAQPEAPGHRELIEAIATHCLRAYDRFWRQRLEIEWLVDPPPDTVIAQRWDIVAFGLRADDVIELASDSVVRGRGAASAKGVARIRTVLAPNTPTLALRRVAGSKGRDPVRFEPEVHRLVIAQTPLVLQQTIALRGACIELVSFRGAGMSQLAVLTQVGLESYSIEDARLRKRSSVVERGLRSVAAVRGGIVAYGPTTAHRFEALEDGRLMASRATESIDAAANATLDDGLLAPRGKRLPMAAARARPRATDREVDLWLGTSVKVGKLLVRVGAQRRYLEVYGIGTTRLLKRPWS